MEPQMDSKPQEHFPTYYTFLTFEQKRHTSEFQAHKIQAYKLHKTPIHLVQKCWFVT